LITYKIKKMKQIIFTVTMYLSILNANAQIMMLPGIHEYKDKRDATSQTIYTTNGKINVSYSAVGRDNPYGKGSADGLKADLEEVFGDKKYNKSEKIYFSSAISFFKGKYFYHVLNADTETEIVVSSKNNDVEFKKVCDMVLKKYND